jgi:hypothetical protein
MIILIISTSIFLLGIILGIFTYKFEIFSACVTAISSLFLLFYLLGWPISYYIGKSKIKEYYAIKSTIENFRKNNDKIENTALILRVLELNEELASIKYWNDTDFDWWYPDELAELEYLK